MTTISAVNFLTETGSAAFNAGRRALLTHYWPSEASNDRGVWNTRFNAMLPPALQIAADSRPAQFRPAYSLLNSTALWVAGYAFAASQAGGLWQGTVASSLFSDTAGTTAATLGGQVARINDGSGAGLNLTQDNASLRPLRGRRPRTGVRNLLRLSSDFDNAAWLKLAQGSASVPVVTAAAAAAPDGTMTATRVQFERALATAGNRSWLWSPTPVSTVAGLTYTISLWIRSWSGASQSLVINQNANGAVATAFTATATWQRVSLSFVSGAAVANDATVRIGLIDAASPALTSDVLIWGAQVEVGAAASAYQNVVVGATVFDVTEAGVPDVSILGFDHVDDSLPSPAIAGGLTGQAFVAGDGGCYVTDLSIAPGGTFQVGGASLHNWTGAPHGALRAVSNNTGRVLDANIRAGTFTEAEIAALERFYVALGGRALLVPDGPNLWTGTPNRVDPECTVTADDAVSFNTTTTRLVGWTSASPKLDLGAWYLASMNLTRTSGTFVTPYTGSGADLLNTTTAGVNTRIFRATTRELYVGTNGAAVGAMSAISVRRLVNRSL